MELGRVNTSRDHVLVLGSMWGRSLPEKHEGNNATEALLRRRATMKGRNAQRNRANSDGSRIVGNYFLENSEKTCPKKRRNFGQSYRQKDIWLRKSRRGGDAMTEW